MERVLVTLVGFKTSDGMTFLDEAQAANHERVLEAEGKVLSPDLDSGVTVTGCGRGWCQLCRVTHR